MPEEVYDYDQDVNYTLVDKLKVAAQQAARTTAKNMERRGAKEITFSRGESCYLFEVNGQTLGFVVEGLGTKNRAMDNFRKQLDFFNEVLNQNAKASLRRVGHPHSDAMQEYYARVGNKFSPYFNAAVDTAMMIFLDMASIGVMPIVLGAHYALGASEWFNDDSHIQEYCDGMVHVCNEVGCTWGPGETPVLTDIISPSSAVLDGAAIGTLIAKEPILGQELQAGDVIIFLQSEGLQANYLSGARWLAEKLPAGYLTAMEDGTLFGSAVSTPTNVRYISVIEKLISEEVGVKYIVPITGHGLRKIMRARTPFTYRLNRLAPLNPLFRFMIKGLGLEGESGAEQAYGGMNLGQGLAIIVSPGSGITKVIDTTASENIHAWIGGCIEDGPRQVIIENPDPIFKINGSIVFDENSMKIRPK